QRKFDLGLIQISLHRQSKFDLGLNKDPSGLSASAGLSHTTSNGHKFGGSVSHSLNGITSGSLGYSKSFDNGNGKIGAQVSRDFHTGDTFVGAGLSWRFRRGLRA
ncbi:hypothetical protein RRG08_061418, partial [Elysia crispata]